MEQNYERFGGWLLFFWLICLYNSFILTLNVFGYGQTLFLATGRNVVSDGIFAMENLIIGCLFFIMVLKLIKRNQENPGLAKRLLLINIILGGVYLLLNGVISPALFHYKPGFDNAELRNPFVMLLGSWIWMTYFHKSKRVRVYYRLPKPDNTPEDSPVNSN